MLEGTDCEFCLQHPIFGFFFFEKKKKLFFSIDLCVVLRVSVLAKGTHPQNLVPDLEKR